MDFALSEEQLAVSEAATGLLLGPGRPRRASPPSSRATSASTAPCGRPWPTPTCSGLAVPEPDGGAGYGLMELCLLLEAQGNAVAPVPLWATLVLGALPIARFGSRGAAGRAGCPASSPAT